MGAFRPSDMRFLPMAAQLSLSINVHSNVRHCPTFQDKSAKIAFLPLEIVCCICAGDTLLPMSCRVRCIRLLGFRAESRPQKISENSCCNAKPPAQRRPTPRMSRETAAKN